MKNTLWISKSILCNRNGWLLLEIILASVLKGITKQLLTGIRGNKWFIGPSDRNLFCPWPWATFVSPGPTNRMLPSFLVNDCIIYLRMNSYTCIRDSVASEDFNSRCLLRAAPPFIYSFFTVNYSLWWKFLLF